MASWEERVADRSPTVRRSRLRTLAHARTIVDAARRLVRVKGADFTTQDLTREAGVALQTFYRHFPSKDHLLAAVLEAEIADGAARLAALVRDLPDPVSRLRGYVEAILSGVSAPADADDDAGPAGIGPRFITSEHWRLRQTLPADVDRAVAPIVDLIASELRAAQAAGLLHPNDVDRDATLLAKLLMSVYHHYAYAPTGEPTDQLIDHVWAFCLTGLGGGTPGGPPGSTQAGTVGTTLCGLDQDPDRPT